MYKGYLGFCFQDGRSSFMEDQASPRLDIGNGKEIDLKEWPSSKLRHQCIKYLGPDVEEKLLYDTSSAFGVIVTNPKICLQLKHVLKRMEEKKQVDLGVFKWFKVHVIESKLEPSMVCDFKT